MSALAVKKLPLKQQKAEAVSTIEDATEISMPEQIKKQLFKAITTTNNGKMTADALSAITTACQTYMELDALPKKK